MLTYSCSKLNSVDFYASLIISELFIFCKFCHSNMENALGTVVFNVGGRKFECLLSTVQEHPCSVLAHVVESRIQYNLSTKEYFFDRNPAIFNSVLEYLRTGELHIPNTVCGLVAKRELEFWGVDEKEIEPCCWKRYNEYQSKLSFSLSDVSFLFLYLTASCLHQ